MNWTFRLGRIWGVEVLIHWTLPAWILLDMFRHKGVPPAWMFLSMVIEVAFFGMVLLHELGHCWAARRHGLPADRILLWPLGGLAMVGTGMERPSTELKISLAGPAVSLSLALLGYGLVFLQGHDSDPTLATYLARLFASLNMSLFLFNLIPCYPMDGGRATRALLSLWMGRVRASLITAKLAMGISILFALWGISSQNFILVMIAVFLFFQARAEHKLYSQLPSGGPYEVYWRGQRIEVSPGAREEPRRKRPSWFQVHKARQAQKRWLKENERVEKIKMSVDDILDKMNEVGFDGLTPEEQKTLQDASRIPPSP